jgi:K+-sensing histidine kinase KdpD
LSSPPNALGQLLQCLVRHAVAATPRDGSVRVSAATNSTRFELVVEDGGPTVPRAARQALIDHRVEPATLGRPAGFDLLVASLIVEHLGGSLSIEETSGGRASVHVSLPLATRGAASPR